MPDFGYAVGDFIAIVKLAWQLYDSCYQVVKDAPGEFLALCNELGALNIALTHVQNDLTRPESKLLQHGEDRLKSLKMASDNLNLTLLQLAKIVDKYKPVVRKTTSATVWNKIRWTLEQNNIVKIRLKLTSHVAILNLIVSSIGNSSLERIECILQRMDIPTLGPRCEGTNVLLEGSQGIYEGATGQGRIADDLVIGDLKSTCGRVLATEEETRPLFSNHTGDAGSVYGIQIPGFEFDMCVPDSPAHSPAMNDENPRNGRKTMLHWAAENGWHSVAEKLLAIEDPNSKDELGQTPLHLVAKKGSESVVKLLLTRGADSTARDNSGLTPLHRAIESGSEAVVNLLPNLSELILPTTPSWLPLHEAASQGSVQMATWLLDKRVDSTLQDSDGDTALHVAARKGKEKVVLLLLDYGMDGNAQNYHGQTPLNLAVIFEHESIARILLGRGADSMLPDEEGNTAFHDAVARCSIS